MALTEYQRRRDFGATPEPRGGEATATGRAFCVQMHDATRLHYDFRLEHGGVLLSWAVTRGPSDDPGEKRLAVRVEDHPTGYRDFEGVIPEGYGAGAVLLWDRGEWQPEGDVDAGLTAGKLTFTLEGDRMRGGWALVRMRGEGRRENWLLVKESDAFAGDDPDRLTRDFTTSVATGRTLAEIAGRPAGKRGAEAARQVGGIRITHPDRVVFPKPRITKGGLADYYAAVTERLLAHGQGRPLSLIRCPDGIAGTCFFQKHGGKGWPKAVSIFAEGGEDWLWLRDRRALIASVQMGAVEFHIRGVRRDRVERPDRMVFDIDPGAGVGWDAVREAARAIGRVLREAGFEPGVMTTGGKGLHVVVALRRTAEVAAVAGFAKALAAGLAAREPGRFTAAMAKAKRKGRLFVDWQRNTRGATAICPWSVRARPGAPVAMPLAWDELDDVPASNAFTLGDALARLDRDDPLAAIPAGGLSAAAVQRMEAALA